MLSKGQMFNDLWKHKGCMVEDTLKGNECLKLDDSPLKLNLETFKERITDSDMVYKAQPLLHKELAVLNPEEFFKPDSAITLLSIKKEGYGCKDYRGWMKKLDLQQKTDSEAFANFWKEQFDTWTNFQVCNPKVIAAADVVESLSMRLTFHMHNSAAKESIVDYQVTFPPFQSGLQHVSYHTLLWHYHSKRHFIQDSAKWEVKWIHYCMQCGEMAFLEDLKSRGYDMQAVEMSEVACMLREEMLVYMTEIDLKQGRNAAAHIFCSAFQQNVIKQGSGTKVRELLDTVEPMVMSQFYKASLIKILKNLSNMDKLPSAFQGLQLCFRLQLFFLEHVIQNASPVFTPSSSGVMGLDPPVVE